jgi:adenine-specific DNA-methyltransferase
MNLTAFMPREIARANPANDNPARVVPLPRYIIDPDRFRIDDENPANDNFRLEAHPRGNLVIEGDNLHSLSALRGERVDVIYIDPPYNTGKNTLRYQDRQSRWPSFIYNRLVLARDLMKDSASIFVSIDDHEFHTLRLIMDAVFGAKNRIATFIWRKSHTVKNDKKGISIQHEYVFCYAKDATKAHFNREQTGNAYIDRAYRYHDTAGRFRVVPLHKATNRKSFAVTAPHGTVWMKNWNFYEAGMGNLIANDLVYWGNCGTKCPQKKVYLKPTAEMTKTYGSMLPPEKVGFTGDGGKALEALGFGKAEFFYAKPVDLIRHLLEIASTPTSTVLDFFAGSGTTGEAVMRLNALDGGTRRFILCNSNENNICETITYPRVAKAAERLGETVAFTRVMKVAAL